MNVTTASRAMAFDTGAPRNQTAFGLCSCAGDVDMIYDAWVRLFVLLGDAYQFIIATLSHGAWSCCRVS